MSTNLVHCNTMQNAAVIIVAFLLLCLTFNYTFPFHRENTKWSPLNFHNRSKTCDVSHRHVHIAKRNKIDDFETIHDKMIMQSPDRHAFDDHDLRQFEQLVIMKKYPYLDHKELQIQLNPSSKNARQSDKMDTWSGIISDSRFHEGLEEGPNVEIINRGLTGFAIPSKMSLGIKDAAGSVTKAHMFLDNVFHENVSKRLHNAFENKKDFQ